ncbi:FAD:protein FMN transferase [Agromyces sp. MMS24-K17]|uniref:FAD:protein FMN transferase n=1 Tax=Agromyces sp. MMS24-K17 TaxID=3372850 RepID=UPI0037549387
METTTTTRADAPLPAGAFRAMGTVVSVRLDLDLDLDLDAAARRCAAVAGAEAAFARWEARCSLFDPDSELSRIGRGELALVDADASVRDAYALASHWRAATDGAFTPHRGDGRIDLNGVVKALAAVEAGEAIASAGVGRWAIDAGGDVLVSRAAADEGPLGADRQVGIVDPWDRTALLARFDLDGWRRRALATSGSAERGDHIWTRPGEGLSPFVQVSVAAADLVTADVLATAIVAGGQASLDDLAARHDVDVLAVTRSGGLLATPGWPRADRAPR